MDSDTVDSMKEASSVHFIITGGTIDSYYDGSIDTVKPYSYSIMPRYILSLRLYREVEFTELCMKDSRDITTEDREDLLKAIQESKHNHFVITHGTYTMPDTARFLDGRLESKDQVIILTGAMIPLEIINSDAAFNLGHAFASVDTLDPGVYICMNGAIFTADEVAKDLSEGRFTSLFNK